MKNSLRKLLLQILVTVYAIVMVSINSNAAHIVGGEMTYVCIDSDLSDNVVEFEITATFYQDLLGGGYLTAQDFGIYRELSQDNWEWFDTVLEVNFSNRIMIPFPELDSCVDSPHNIGKEQFTYVFNLALPISTNNYMIAYQRCCWNAAINNLQSPGETGFANYVVITPEAQSSCDNSPKFNELPPVFVCKGQFLDVDHSILDLEGDVLRYSFCSPKTAGGTDGSGGPNSGSFDACTGVVPNPQNCLPPFQDMVFIDPVGAPNGLTWQSPILGDPVITIDENTGIISGVPNQVGKYIVGVCVQSFRNDNFIGEVRRVFQFDVVECNPTVIASLDGGELVGPKDYLFTLCGETEFEIENTSVQLDEIVTVEWTVDIDGVMDVVTDRDASFEFPATGLYNGTMVLNGGLECADTAFFTVDVVNNGPIAEFDCSPADASFGQTEIQLTDQSSFAERLLWIIPGLDTLEERNPTFILPDTGILTVILIAIDANGCADTLSKNIDVIPESRVFFPNSFTPNNDGKNDVFIPVGIDEGISSYNLSVWSRSGEFIFESDDFSQGWNGSKNNNGSSSLEGTYIYTYRYISSRGDLVDGQGKILLLR